MRHGFIGRRLNRPADERKAMLRNLMGSLVRHERIITTEARAKELRRHIERLITIARRGGLHSRRLVLARLPDPPAAEKLSNTIAPRFRNRPGGYTRITRVGFRKGDGAMLAQIEFVEGEPEAASA